MRDYQTGLKKQGQSMCSQPDTTLKASAISWLKVKGQKKIHHVNTSPEQTWVTTWMSDDVGSGPGKWPGIRKDTAYRQNDHFTRKTFQPQMYVYLSNNSLEICETKSDRGKEGKDELTGSSSPRSVTDGTRRRRLSRVRSGEEHSPPLGPVGR